MKRLALSAVVAGAALLTGGDLPVASATAPMPFVSRAPSAEVASPRREAVSPRRAVVQRLKVTVLSTMLAGDPGRGIGEWGFAALLEVDGQRLLIDTGARPGTVLQNARELGIDLSTVGHVVLTHNHDDHTNGLLTLRRELRAKNPGALQVAHVAPEIFYSRGASNGVERNGVLRERSNYEALGGRYEVHASATELLPGVWFTGSIPRVHPERNFGGVGGRGMGTVQTPAGAVEDNVPEDASLVINTAEGLVVITGCGHAGIVNIVTKAQAMVPNTTVHAIVGGMHLLNASDETLAWTGGELKARGVDYLLGVHCTGVEATYRLRSLLGLSRSAAATGAVGSSFTLGAGIDPLVLAR